MRSQHWYYMNVPRRKWCCSIVYYAMYPHIGVKMCSAVRCKSKIINLPKTKKFGCVDRGNLTLLFFSKVVKYIKVRGDLFTNVDDNKSFTSRPSGQ